jgi:hypothetical protein
MTYRVNNSAEEVKKMSKYYVQIARHFLSMTVLTVFAMN